MRLPDEPGTPGVVMTSGSGSRPGSSSRKASLSRLPDDGSGAGQCQRPSSGKMLGGTAPVNSKLRDRLNMSLTVATGPPGQGGVPPGEKTVAKLFRVLREGETIQDHYDFGEEIYSGGAKGKVVVAHRRSDNMEVVVKIRTKQANSSNERTWRCIMSQMHSMGGSVHVLNILEIVEGASAFFIVMPKCNGGELFEFLATETEVPEAECKRIIREILCAVGHLHKNNLIHRDIKPENIMFNTNSNIEGSPKTVKLIDFDTCFEWTPMTPKSRRFVGTPGYIAPEALLGELSPQSDLWSVGVILYILMTGEMPWSQLVSLEDGVVGSPGAKRMYNSLQGEVLEWDDGPWPEFPLARDLCQKLLAFKTEERISTVQEALTHPWLRT